MNERMNELIRVPAAHPPIEFSATAPEKWSNDGSSAWDLPAAGEPHTESWAPGLRLLQPRLLQPLREEATARKVSLSLSALK